MPYWVYRHTFIKAASFALGIGLLLTGKALGVPSYVISNNEGGTSLGSYLELYDDTKEKLTLKDVIDPAFGSHFEPSRLETPNFGLETGNVWGRFKVQNPFNETRSVYLENYYALSKLLSLFEPDGHGGYLETTLGTHVPYDQRKIKNRYVVFKVDVPAGFSGYYYVKLETTGTRLLPLYAWTERSFFQHSEEETLILGLILGFFCSMIAYNTFLFFSFKDRVYLYYIANIFAFATYVSASHGLTESITFTNSNNNFLTNDGFLVSAELSIMLGCAFAVEFLGIKKRMPRMYLAFLLQRIMCIFDLVVILPLSYNLCCKTANMNIAFGCVLMIVAGISSVLHGYRPAYFYTLAWLSILVGNIGAVLKFQGILPINFFTHWGQPLAGALEVVLNSLALGDRVNDQRRRASEKIKGLNAELQVNYDRLKEQENTRSAFFRNTSHELRTPINGILGYASLILKISVAECNELLGERAQKIAVLAKNLLAHVNTILDLAKLQEGTAGVKKSGILLGSFSGEIKDMAQGLVQRYPGTSFDLSCSYPAAAVLADRQKLMTVVQNLISNAFKFSRAQVSNNITCKIDESAPGKMRITVSDTGIGIAAENHQRIFEEFVQVEDKTDRAFEGTGLGLAMVKKLTELMGGEISVKSALQVGSTFVVTIPVENADASSIIASSASVALKDEVFKPVATKGKLIYPPPPVASQASVSSEEAHEILIVDDNEINIEVLCAYLSPLGCRINTATSGQAGLNIMRQKKIDLVLLDLMMPHMSGSAVMKEIRQDPRLRNIPIIIVTAHAAEEDKMRALEMGADDYLPKPVVEQEVIFRVRNTLERVMLAKERGKTEQMIHQDKLNSLGALAAGVAHEINNPIQIISGIADNMDQLSQSGSITPERLAKYTMKIQNAISRISSITDGLQIYARKPNSDPLREESVDTILDTVINLSREMLGRYAIELRLDKKTSDTVAFCKAGQIVQVLLSMLMNSIDAIKTSKDPWIAIDYWLENGNVMIAITDCGTGIPKEIASKIFDPFYTSKEVGTGIGLGLSVAKGVMFDHKGDLVLDSKSQNTRFIISFPANVTPIKAAS